MIRRYITISSLLLSSFLSFPGKAQTPGFSATEYKKALWMTTRMYGGQRSGDKNTNAANWLLIGQAGAAADGRTFLNDGDGGYDLSGGWFDCGDHVKFGHTEFFAGYILLKGYAEFSKGYDDRYAQDYAGYKSAGNYNFEGSGHKANAIPDILDEVKHATDYYIKCTRDASTFYSQVGDGGADHQQWVTSAKMQSNPTGSGGQPRAVVKNPNDGAMPALAGAALALMSRIYKPYNAAYAQTCLDHAKFAYTYAKAHKGQAVAAPGGFYPAHSNPNDAYACLLAELYWATKDEAYKTEALAMTVAASAGTAQVRGNTYGMDYANNGDLGVYNLYLLGKTGAEAAFNTIVNTHYLSKVTANGQFSGGNVTYGPLRYNGNAAFTLALWAKRNSATDAAKKFIYSNIDYILGKNTRNYSFVVGFGATSAAQPHHRNVFMSDANNMNGLTIPAKNRQHGYMVGGSREANTYQDNINSYQFTEGGIDYSGGLVGALGWINSQVAPVTTTFQAVEEIPTPIISATESVEELEALAIYPNPSSNNFSIQVNQPYQVKVINQLGNEVMQFNISAQTLFGAELSPGIYHLLFFSNTKMVKSMTVVKE